MWWLVLLWGCSGWGVWLTWPPSGPQHIIIMIVFTVLTNDPPQRQSVQCILKENFKFGGLKDNSVDCVFSVARLRYFNWVMASDPVTELKLGICMSSLLSPAPSLHTTQLLKCPLLIWSICTSWWFDVLRISIFELRLICFKDLPSCFYAKCMKKGRQHILQRLKICQIPLHQLAVFWRVMSFEELLKEFIWMMSYEERKGFVLRVSGLDVTVVGAGAWGDASKVQLWAPPAAPGGRAGPTTPVFNLEWLHYSWGQCRLLVAAASSLGRCPKLFPSLLACSLCPSGNKRLCCYFPDDCVLLISFLAQAEKLQFHKEPVILINVLPARVCPSQNL